MRRAGRGEGPIVSSLVLTAAFAIVSAIGLWHHEMWRDEYQAWLVARDAHSIAQLFANLRYEGNPALWHLLLYPLTAITSDPRVMQVLNYLLAVAAVWVISLRAPFPWLWKVLLVFGYYALFEFSLISRSYALGFLLVAIACAWYPTRRTRPIRLAMILALLANTHVFGLSIAAAIGFVASADVFLPWFRARPVSIRTRAWFLAIVIAGSVVSLIQIIPEPDNSFPVKRPEAGLDVRRLVESIAEVARSYLPIPGPGLPHFWNTNVLDFVRPAIAGWTPTRVEALLAVALLLVFFWHFRRRPLIASAYLTGSAALLVVQYAIGFGLQRYIGHFFVMLVAAMWMSDDVRPMSWRGSMGQWAFTLVLFCGSVGGLMAWGADVRQPFTRNGELVAFIRSAHLDQDEIVAMADHAASPLAAELNRRLYFPQLGADGSFTVWSGQRHETLTPADLIQQIATIVGRSSKHRAVLVLNVPSVDVLSPVISTEPLDRTPLADGLTIQRIHHVPLAIVIGEEYWVYLVEGHGLSQKSKVRSTDAPAFALTRFGGQSCCSNRTQRPPIKGF